MEIIKPKKLQKGNTIGILAISGRIKEYERIEHSKLFFESEGYKVIISDTCKSSHGYMSGNNDEECIKALHNFFENNEIDVILCARGGYGTLRLINKIDWNIIKNNPKIFAGYSDITILLNMIYKKTGLITFHSAMANGDFGDEIKDYTKESFFKALTGESVLYKAESGIVYKEGIAEGILWGGNLSSLVSLCGIDFIPEDENLILFLEDLNEPVYKIDRMLTQLFNMEKIRNKVKGIILGDFQNTKDDELLKELIINFSEQFQLPCCDGFKITHDKIKDTIPIGVNVKFNAKKGLVELVDKYVC